MAPAVIAALVLAACGNDESSGEPLATDPPIATDPPGTDPATTDPPTSDAPTVSFESEARPAGPLFGSGAPDADSENDTPSAEEMSEDPCAPDDPPECEDAPPLPPDVPPPFQPTGDHAPFCTLLADMEQRDYPTDDFEQLLVAQAWFAELQPTVPQEITAPFGLVVELVDQVVAQQGDLEQLDAPGPEFEDAIIALGEFVDGSCYGRT